MWYGQYKTLTANDLIKEYGLEIVEEIYNESKNEAYLERTLITKCQTKYYHFTSYTLKAAIDAEKSKNT
jgi:hypothetical protein